MKRPCFSALTSLIPSSKFTSARTILISLYLTKLFLQNSLCSYFVECKQFSCSRCHLNLSESATLASCYRLNCATLAIKIYLVTFHYHFVLCFIFFSLSFDLQHICLMSIILYYFITLLSLRICFKFCHTLF